MKLFDVRMCYIFIHPFNIHEKSCACTMIINGLTTLRIAHAPKNFNSIGGWKLQSLTLLVAKEYFFWEFTNSAICAISLLLSQSYSGSILFLLRISFFLENNKVTILIVSFQHKIRDYIVKSNIIITIILLINMPILLCIYIILWWS